MLQFYNVANLASRGMGTILEFQKISKESVSSAINFALQLSTQRSAKTVSYSFRNRAQQPLSTAIWWVEHVAVTRGAPLTTSHSPFMVWYEYHSIDVIVCILSSSIIFVAIWIWIIKKLCGCNERSLKEKSQ